MGTSIRAVDSAYEYFIEEIPKYLHTGSYMSGMDKEEFEEDIALTVVNLIKLRLKDQKAVVSK